MSNDSDIKENNFYGKIDFLGAKGIVGETILYDNKASYKKEIEESFDIGRPISVTELTSEQYSLKINEDEYLYKLSEVSKLDKTKGKLHIYQMNDEPEKCFSGKKLNTVVERIGDVGSIEIVKNEFKDFLKHESYQNIEPRENELSL